MEHFSNKYQKWFGCYESNRHPRSFKLFKIGKYYYRPDKDQLIHEDIVEEYIDNTEKAHKRHRRDSYCKKNNIDITD